MVTTQPILPALLELNRKDIPYRTFQHSGSVKSLTQAAVERRQLPEQVVRSILFRLAKDEFCLALVAGPAQIDWRKLRKHFNQSRLTMAAPDEVLRITGYIPGAVSPFGLPAPVPVIADPNVFKPDEISLGSGQRGLAIIIKTSDLMHALGEIEIFDLLG